MNRFCISRSSATISIVLALAISAVPGCAQTSPQRITAGELNTILVDRQAVVVDVRETRDWDRSDQKIKGAVRIDPANLDPEKLPIAKNAMIILY